MTTVLLLILVSFFNFQIYQCGIENLREKEEINLRLTNAALLTSQSALERRRSSAGNARDRLRKIAVKHPTS